MKYVLVLSILFFQAGSWKSLDAAEFKINYPSEWELNQTGMAGTKFILFMPSGQSVTFRDNVNLIIQDLKDQPMTLKEFAELSSSQVKQFITNANIVTSETSADGRRHKMVYSGSQGSLDLKWQQYYWVKNEKAYILTFTADRTSYDQKIEKANQVMNSFVAK